MAKHIRDHRGKNWFWAENAIIDVYGARLSSQALNVYFLLARMADDKTQTCYPSYNLMKEKLGIARSTAVKAIAELRECGLIDVMPQYTASGDPTSNLYTLMPLPEAAPDAGSMDSGIGSAGDGIPVFDDGIGGSPSNGHKQDSDSNKTNKQGTAAQILKPSLMKAARVAFAALEPADQQYITRVAEDDSTDIETAMWKYRDTQVAYALRAGK